MPPSDATPNPPSPPPPPPNANPNAFNQAPRGIIPQYMLANIAKSQDAPEEARAAAQNTLVHTEALHQARVDFQRQAAALRQSEAEAVGGGVDAGSDAGARAGAGSGESSDGVAEAEAGDVRTLDQPTSGSRQEEGSGRSAVSGSTEAGTVSEPDAHSVSASNDTGDSKL